MQRRASESKSVAISYAPNANCKQVQASNLFASCPVASEVCLLAECILNVIGR